MLQWRPRYPHFQLVDADEVREKGVREEERDDGVHAELQQPPRMEVSLLSIELLRERRRSFDQALQRPVNELHPDGLRTGPTTPDPSEERRQQKNRERQDEEKEHEEERVRRKKRVTEERELPVGRVEQNERLAVHPDVRDGDEDDYERVRHHPPQMPPVARRGSRPNPAPGSVLVHRGEH